MPRVRFGKYIFAALETSFTLRKALRHTCNLD